MPKSKEKCRALDLPRGPLTEPIRLSRLHHVWCEGTPEDIKDAYYESVSRKQRAQKLNALADALAIQGKKQRRWYELALKLATLYVPGFQVARPQRRRGAPSLWNFQAQQRLVLEVHRLKHKRLSETTACVRLSERKAICDVNDRPFTPEALRTELRRLKKSKLYQRIVEARPTKK